MDWWFGFGAGTFFGLFIAAVMVVSVKVYVARIEADYARRMRAGD